MAGRLILDSSALLALLQQETGAERVAGIIDQARMSVVNYAEIVSYYAKLGSSRDAIDAMLEPLPLTLVPADTELAADAGMLRPVTAEAGLSVGDRFCLALARREGLEAWTADRAWTRVARKVNVKIVVIR
jgi:PIN domain nuclease of toxin-antitoxin system